MAFPQQMPASSHSVHYDTIAAVGDDGVEVIIMEDDAKDEQWHVPLSDGDLATREEASDFTTINNNAVSPSPFHLHEQQRHTPFRPSTAGPFSVSDGRHRSSYSSPLPQVGTQSQRGASTRSNLVVTPVNTASQQNHHTHVAMMPFHTRVGVSSSSSSSSPLVSDYAQHELVDLSDFSRYPPTSTDAIAKHIEEELRTIEDARRARKHRDFLHQQQKNASLPSELFLSPRGTSQHQHRDVATEEAEGGRSNVDVATKKGVGLPVALLSVSSSSTALAKQRGKQYVQNVLYLVKMGEAAEKALVRRPNEVNDAVPAMDSYGFLFSKEGGKSSQTAPHSFEDPNHLGGRHYSNASFLADAGGHDKSRGAPRIDKYVLPPTKWRSLMSGEEDDDDDNDAGDDNAAGDDDDEKGVVPFSDGAPPLTRSERVTEALWSAYYNARGVVASNAALREYLLLDGAADDALCGDSATAGDYSGGSGAATTSVLTTRGCGDKPSGVSPFPSLAPSREADYGNNPFLSPAQRARLAQWRGASVPLPTTTTGGDLCCAVASSDAGGIGHQTTTVPLLQRGYSPISDIPPHPLLASGAEKAGRTKYQQQQRKSTSTTPAAGVGPSLQSISSPTGAARLDSEEGTARRFVVDQWVRETRQLFSAFQTNPVMQRHLHERISVGLPTQETRERAAIARTWEEGFRHHIVKPFFGVGGADAGEERGLYRNDTNTMNMKNNMNRTPIVADLITYTVVIPHYRHAMFLWLLQPLERSELTNRMLLAEEEIVSFHGMFTVFEEEGRLIQILAASRAISSIANDSNGHHTNRSPASFATDFDKAADTSQWASPASALALLSPSSGVSASSSASSPIRSLLWHYSTRDRLEPLYGTREEAERARREAASDAEARALLTQHHRERFRQAFRRFSSAFESSLTRLRWEEEEAFQKRIHQPFLAITSAMLREEAARRREGPARRMVREMFGGL